MGNTIFERIASTAGVYIHGDFSIKGTLPLIFNMLVGSLPNSLSLRKDGLPPMANRTRPNQILFCVSDDEKRIIQAKMAQLGTKNMGALSQEDGD